MRKQGAAVAVAEEGHQSFLLEGKKRRQPAEGRIPKKGDKLQDFFRGDSLLSGKHQPNR
jgi:hypothetical protein